MLPELAFDLLEVLAEPVHFAEGRFVVVGGVGEQRPHLVTIEAPEGRREVGLAQIERGHFHGPGLLHISTGPEKHIPYHAGSISISGQKL